jgi:hypothetical protein
MGICHSAASSDRANASRRVRPDYGPFRPTHEVAALRPAARQQEPRGREPVERTAIGGVARSTQLTSVALACNT